MAKKIRIYVVKTKFPGSDSTTKFYFRKKKNAEEFEKTLEISDGVGWLNYDPEENYEYEEMYGDPFYDNIWEMEKREK